MKELTVIYRGHGQNIELGTLADDGQDLLFQYSAAAIACGLELSPIRLPLRIAAYPDQQTQYVNLQHLPGLLYDSLPDSWGNRLMHRHMQAHGINPDTLSALDRLAYLGENTMGALSYVPSGSLLNAGTSLYLAQLAAEIQAVLTDVDREVLAEVARVGGSPGGVRPKALVYFNPQSGQMSTQPGHVDNAQAWLVKFASDDDEADSCALEYLYARIAQHCELGMMATHFFQLPGGLSAFGTQRFDRLGQQRVHVHTLAGLLHANFQIPSVSYEDFFRTTRHLTRDLRELKKAVQRCAFNVLMNNRDDHAKNISYRQERDGTWHLAPPYDLTYCPGYQGQHFMDVVGEGRAPTREHIIKAAKTAGLGACDTGTLIDELLARGTPTLLREWAGQLPIRSKTVALVAKAMEANCARLRKA